jgi:hypothetical protein
MDQYGNNGNQGAMPDPGAGYGGTYPASQESGVPQQQQMFPGQPAQQAPQQRMIDPAEFDRAVQALHQWEQYGTHIERQNADLQQQNAAEKARQAMAADEYRIAQQVRAKYEEADRILEDDPRRARQLYIEAQNTERQERIGQRDRVIEAAGRALQQTQQQFQVPQQVQQAVQQFQLSGEQADLLRQLQPHQIPAVAQALGMSEAKVREAQRRQQTLDTQQQRQQMQQSGAHAAPALSGAPSQGQPAPGSREALRAALALDPDFAHLYRT